jgi:hypothetical protein
VAEEIDNAVLARDYWLEKFFIGAFIEEGGGAADSLFPVEKAGLYKEVLIGHVLLVCWD